MSVITISEEQINNKIKSVVGSYQIITEKSTEWINSLSVEEYGIFRKMALKEIERGSVSTVPAKPKPSTNTSTAIVNPTPIRESIPSSEPEPEPAFMSQPEKKTEVVNFTSMINEKKEPINNNVAILAAIPD